MNTREDQTIVQSSVKGAIVGATLGSVLPIASLAFPNAFPTKDTSMITYHATMLSVAVINFLHEAIPASLRPSEWLSPIIPEFAAPVVDLATAGFVVGAACHGLFAATRAATKPETENKHKFSF